MLPTAQRTRRLLALKTLAAAFLVGATGSLAQSVTERLPDEVTGVTWQWIWFGSGAEQFDVDRPERYTLQFGSDGIATMQADCNRGTAHYSLGPDRSITLAPIAATMKLCDEGSLDARFLGGLEQVGSYFKLDDDFLLEAPLDSGTLRFRRAPAD